jgi:uncharacterized protein (TIGR02246 family)
MTKSALFLSVAALLLTACQAEQKPANENAEVNNASAADTAADERAIREHVDHWLELVKAKDAGAIAQLYTEDGAVMPPNAPIGKGRAAIEKTWASMMQTPGFDLTFAPEEIVVSSSGDLALDRGTYRFAFDSAGKSQTDVGKYVVVWRKVGGDWKAAADIFNSDAAPAGT